MATCPNKNLQEWKDLVDNVGSPLAHFLWDKYKGEVPLEEYTLETSIKPGVAELFESNPELANEVYEALIPQGYTRLYRSEDDTSKDKPAPDWVKESDEYKAGEEVKGRWFYKTLNEAIEHSKKFGSSGISYIDIPTNQVETFNAKDNKFAGGYGKQGNEYFVTKELANNRKSFEQQKQQAQQQYSNYLDTIYNGISIELGRSAERAFGKVQNIIISYNGTPITSQDGVAGLGEMNVVIKDGEIIVGMIKIPQEYQNKGLTKYIYQAVADKLQLPVVNSKLKGYNQSESGGYIWKNRTSFNPILGSKQDIEGFKEYTKEFVNKSSQREQDLYFQIDNRHHTQKDAEKILNEVRGKNLSSSEIELYNRRLQRLSDSVGDVPWKLRKSNAGNWYVAGYKNGDVTRANYYSAQASGIFKQLTTVPASRASLETLAKMKEAAKKMGINIQALDEYLKENPDVETKGVNGLADAIRKIIAIAHGKENVALTEEIVHIALAMIEQTNPQIITSLISKISGFKIYDITREAYKNDKRYQLSNGKPDIRKIKEEAVGKLIAELIVKQNEGSTEFPELIHEKNRSLVRELWNIIMSAIRNLYKKSNVDLFAETARMISEGNVEPIEVKDKGLFLQIAANSKVDSFYDTVMSYAARMELHPEIKEGPNKDTRHYTFDEKRVRKSVTERIKEKSAKRFDKRTPEQKKRDDEKREWGSRLHDYLYKYITLNLIDKDGYKRKTFGNAVVATEIKSSITTKLDSFMIDLINSYPEGTRFVAETMVINTRYKGMLASTVDFMAIEPVIKDGVEDLRVDVFDWKTLSIYEEQKEQGIPWFKEKEWKEQMGDYSQIVFNYGLKPTQLRKRRMIPFVLNYKDRVRGDKSQGQYPASIEIGKLNDPKGTSLYLLPVPTNEESSGNPRIDSLIESLRNLWEELYIRPATPQEKFTKIQQLNQLSVAIRQLHIALNFEPLVNVGDTFLRSSFKTLSEFKNADLNKLTNEQIKKALKDLGLFAETARKITEIDRIYLSQYPREGLSKEDKLTLNKLEHISNASERLLEQIESAQRRYVINLAAKEGVNLEEVETEQGIKIAAEATINGILRTFENPSKIPIKLLNLTIKLISNAKNLVNVQFIRKMKEFNELLIPLEQEARSLGKKAFTLIGRIDESGLHLIHKLDKDFWESLSTARENSNKKFLMANMDMNKFDELAKKTMDTLLEDINNTQFSQDKQQDEEKRKIAIKNMRNAIDIRRETFNGYNGYAFGYIMNECIIEEGHLSSEYSNMSPAAKKVWEFFVALNRKGREIGYLDKQGSSFFPLIEATILQKFQQTNNAAAQIKDLFQDLYSIRINEENIFAKRDSAGKIKKQMPKFFTRTDKNVEQLSTDLGKVGALWMKALMDYETNSNIEDTLLTILSIEKTKGSVVLDVNGNAVFEGGIPKVNYETNKNADLVEAVIDDFLYSLQEDVNSIGSTPINAIAGKTSKTEEDKEKTKLALRKVIKKGDILVRMMGVGLKPLIGFANWAGFQLQAFIQAGGFYKFSEFLRNNARITTGIGLSTIERGLLNMIVPLNENIVEYMQRKTGQKRSFLDYLNTWSFTDLMMSTNTFPERKLQFANGLSFIENSMIVDGKIVNIRHYVREQDRAVKYEKDSLNRYKLAPEERRRLEKTQESRIEELKKTKSLINIAKIEGDNVIIPGVSDEEIARFRTQVTSYVTSLNGQMTEGDKAAYRRDTIVTSFMMFKTWIPSLVSARVSPLQKNLQLDEWQYGRVRVFIKTWSELGFMNIAKMRDIIQGTEEGMKILSAMLEAKRIDHFRKTGQELEITEEEFFDLIRNALVMEMKELGTLFTMMGLIIAARAAEPPEDASTLEKNRYKWWARGINKMSDEITFYYNPTSMETITRGSFLPALGLLSKAEQFIIHLVRETRGIILNDDEMIKKAYPLKYFLNLIPIGAQFQMELLPYISPETAKEMGIRVTTQSRRR